MTLKCDPHPGREHGTDCFAIPDTHTHIRSETIAGYPVGEAAIPVIERWPAMATQCIQPADYPQLFWSRHAGLHDFPISYYCIPCFRPYSRYEPTAWVSTTETARQRFDRRAQEIFVCRGCGNVALWPKPTREGILHALSNV